MLVAVVAPRQPGRVVPHPSGKAQPRREEPVRAGGPQHAGRATSRNNVNSERAANESSTFVVRSSLFDVPPFFFPLASILCSPILFAMETPDQFRKLFEMQKSLNQRIGVHTDTMTEEEKTKWILNYCRAMTQEIAELTDSVPWKWWAKYQKFDEQNARVEVVDLFHFLISMAQVLGMSADDVFNAYCKKNEVNFKRQETGYATKDEHDSKHI